MDRTITIFRVTNYGREFAGSGKVYEQGSVECSADIGDATYALIETCIAEGQTEGTTGEYAWEVVSEPKPVRMTITEEFRWAKCKNVVEELVYNASMDGCCETFGDVETGGHFSLVAMNELHIVENMDGTEWKFQAAIIREDSQGFLDFEWFETESAASERFTNLEEQYYADDESAAEDAEEDDSVSTDGDTHEMDVVGPSDTHRDEFLMFWKGYTSALCWTAKIEPTDPNECSDDSLFESCPGDFNDSHPDAWDEVDKLLSEEDRKTLRDNVTDFFNAQFELLANAAASGRYTWEQAGVDFYLSRCGHGAGYFDRGLGGVGDALQRAAKVYGDQSLYGTTDPETGEILSAYLG